MSLIPEFIYRKIAHRPSLIKIVNNIGWLFIDKILRMVAGLLVGVWLARYLGPEQFGLLSYATAIMILFGAVVTLGLNEIVVRDLIEQPGSANSILGTAFILQLISGLVAVAMMQGTISWLRPEDELVKTIVAILSFSLIFKSFQVIKYWYEFLVLSRYVVLVENAVFLIMLAIKIFLIVFEFDIVYFAWVILVESVVVSFCFVFIYIKTSRSFIDWKFYYTKSVEMLKDSWPLAISGLSAIIYMKTDQIMLSEIVDDRSVGIYVAATRIVESFYFFPYIIVASVFPIIYKRKLVDHEAFMDGIRLMLSVVYVVALVLCFFGVVFSYFIIDSVYGAAYHDSVAVLSVHAFSFMFVFISAVSGKWFLAEGKQKYIFYRSAIGAVVNVLLNLYLIPLYGAVGASISTVLTISFVGFFSNIFSKHTMPIFRVQVEVILFLSLFKFISRNRL